MPPPEREIVHAEHCHRPGLRVGQAADQPQQAAAADGQAQGGRQPRPGRPASASAIEVTTPRSSAVRRA